jgi:hypothetical protein
MISSPMLATLANSLPTGPEWTYEVEWDGYRALAIKSRRGVQLLSRNGKDLARDYPSIVAGVATLKAADVILDGEIVALDSTGQPSFQALQHRRTASLRCLLRIRPAPSWSEVAARQTAGRTPSTIETTGHQRECGTPALRTLTWLPRNKSNTRFESSAWKASSAKGATQRIDPVKANRVV